MKQLTQSELRHLANVGLGFTPSELSDLQALIANTVDVQTSKVGAAVDKRATAAAENAVWKSALVGGAIGTVGGALLGWFLIKKL